MNREEVQRLCNLARRLGSTPRRLLITAAQAIDYDGGSAWTTLRSVRHTGVRHCSQADECANLLLTPVSSYARDTLDTALSALWRASVADKK